MWRIVVILARLTPSMATIPAIRGPRLGRKQVFLPNFVLTLLRTPNLPSTFASFIVPLKLNKLDLRDYLYNCYGIQVLGVRSYIQIQKLTQDKPSARRPKPRKWFRPRSIKKMTVEMELPFAWPEEPKDFDQWDKSTYDAASEYRKDYESKFSPKHKQEPTVDRKSISEQAKAMLKGEDSWAPSNPDAVGLWRNVEEREVETDVDVSKIPVGEENVMETPKKEN
ncbi:hypothetical protein B7494_g2883 [Chlorociboria aeruginascens]|nr:hypothetical protein B7494_g2883 [Chlorociboria aeruginascens]